MKDWIEAFKISETKVKKNAYKKGNESFKKQILETLNAQVAKEKYQFVYQGNKLVPNDIKKAINSEMGTTSGPGQSTTIDVPTEIVRNFLVKIKSNIKFNQHFELKLKLDRPHQIFEIEVIAKDKEL